MQFKPIGSRAIVRLLPNEPPKKGSIILPENHQQSPYQRAVVIAVGDGSPLQSGGRDPCPFAVGDEMVIPRNPHHPPVVGINDGQALIPFSDAIMVVETETRGLAS